MARLKGKVAIVTGASKGIGASIARHLASEGAAVAVNYASSRDGAERIVADIKSKGGRAVAIQADMAVESDIQRLFTECRKAFDRLDVLVNNAGVYEFASLEEVTPAHFHRMYNINVLGLILATREAVKHVGADGGSIINISSVAATSVLPMTSVYSSTKAAVDTLTRVLAAELGPRRIRVNAINPGMIETEGSRTAGVIESDLRKQIEAQTPLGRIGQPDDVAPVAVFLASDDSAWITGQTIHVSGGAR